MSAPAGRGRSVAPRCSRRAIVALSLSLAALGCGSSIPIRYYTLEGPALEPSGGTAAGALRVGVEPIDVAAPYDQDRIAYRPPDARHEIAFYHYHRWAVPTSRALQVGLAGALDRREGIEAEPVTATGAYDAIVGGRVTRLEEVDESEASIRVVLEMIVERRDPGGGDPLALALGAPVEARTVESVVAALSDTLDQAAAKIASELLGR